MAFGFVKGVFGFISVTEKAGNVIIDGLPTHDLQDAIAKNWGTSRINSHMFVSSSFSRVIIPKFFLVEFVYILREIEYEVRNYTARRAVRTILDLIFKNTWLADVENTEPNGVAPQHILNMDGLKNLTLTPLNHQYEFLSKYNLNVPRYHLTGYVLAAPPGSGKTFTGLALGQCLGGDCMIVVSPKNAIRRVWAKEIQEFVKENKTMWVSDEPGEPPPGLNFYVCHYESLSRLIPLIPHFRKRKLLIDLDECHNFNDVKSQRTQTFIQLCKETQCQHVVWASGTPLKSIGSEMMGLLRTIDPFFNRHVEERFKKIFGMSKGRAGDILSHRLGLVSYRVPKKLVVKGEPIVEKFAVKIPDGNRYTLDTIRYEMLTYIRERTAFYKANFAKFQADYQDGIETFKRSPAYRGREVETKNYLETVKMLSKQNDFRMFAAEMNLTNNFENNIIIPVLPKLIKDRFKVAKSVVKYVVLKIRGEALGNILGRRRAECHVSMLPHIDFKGIIENAESKVLIFTSFVAVVEAAEKHLRKMGYEPLTVYGKTNNELNSIVGKFGKDKKANPLVATYKSLSTAVPLTMANTVIFIDQPFRIHEREQAIARAHRIGQQFDVYVFDMLLDTGQEANISTRSQEIMEWSKEQVDLIMGPSSSSMSTEVYVNPFTNELERLTLSSEFFSLEPKVEEVVVSSSRLSKW